MGLVIFAPTPSFACEKMRLLLTHTHGAHTYTLLDSHELHPIYRLFLAFIFSYSLTHLHFY